MNVSLTKIVRAFAVVAMLMFGVAVLLPAGDTFAQTSQVEQGIKDIGGSNATPLPTVIKTIVNVLLYFIGILSVIMVIYGGFRYVTSAGDTSAVASAKNTILYAVVGIVVAVTAYAIVNFVIGAFTQQPAATDPPRECISSPSNPNVQLCNY
jgi:TRAP-type C4-dicarboxylate transport system permease small subunit